MIIGIAKLQVTTEEILKKLDDYKQEQKEVNDRLASVEKQIYYAGGVIGLVVLAIPYIWDVVKQKIGLA